MTHEEAVKILTSHWGGCSDALGLVIALSSLGMLKLDEPLESRESPNYRAYDALSDHLTDLSFLDFKQLLTSADLQIIKKREL